MRKGGQAEHQEQRRLILDRVLGEGTVVLSKRLARIDEALLVRRDVLLVLNLLLDAQDRVPRVHVENDELARVGLDEDQY